MESFYRETDSSYIIYLDCNALYSTAMCDKLPVGGFKLVKVVDYVHNTDNDYGFIHKVNLEYSKHLHDARNAYPLAPERLNGKLIPNLNNKTK